MEAAPAQLEASPEASPASSAASTPSSGSRWRAPPTLRAAGHETPEEAELRAARVMLETEKLKSVASFPFVGRRMRFEASGAVLQITNDGRFSYSTFEGAPIREEVAPGVRNIGPRVVVTWEGVFSVNSASIAGLPLVAAAAAAAAGGLGGTSTGSCIAEGRSSSQVPSDDLGASPEVVADTAHHHQTASQIALVAADSAAQTIEGRGLVRHEAEEWQCRSTILRVSRGESRFAISVSPSYEPSIAIVQPWDAGPGETAQVLQATSLTEDRQQADGRQQRVPPPKFRPLPPHRQRAPRQPGRPRAPRLRFSPSASDLQGLPCGPRSNGLSHGRSDHGHGGRRDPGREAAARKLIFSSSMPQLKDKPDSNGWTREQWKGHFKRSSAALLQNLHAKTQQGCLSEHTNLVMGGRPNTAP